MRTLLRLVAVFLTGLTGTFPVAAQTRPAAPQSEKPAPAAWTTYLQPAAGFAVSSPVDLNLTTTQTRVSSFLGKGMKLKFSGFFGFQPSRSNSSPMLFLATVIEPVSEKALLNLTSKERVGFLDGLPLELVGSGGKVVRRQAIRFNGYPGRDFIVRLKGGSAGSRAVGRVFLIGNRVIALNVWEPDGFEETPPIGRFLDSFRLMTDAEKKKFGTTRTDTMIDADAPVEKSEPVPDKPPIEAPKSGSTFQGNRKNTCE